MMPHPPALVRHLAVATLLMGFGPIPAHAQAAESCQDAARTREREIQQQYLEELKGCRGSRGTECTGPVTRRAQDRHRESDRELAACVAGERARDDGVIRAEEILTPDGRRLLFQLGAEMDVIADQRRQAGPGDPFGEFVTGLAEWAGSTIGFLAQRPGAPVEQMAQGILDYLTTDTAENHRMLQAAAEQGVRDFQQNPARFLGRNLPDLLPVPGGAANEVRALQRVQQVEKAAERIKKMADAEKRLAGLYEKVGPPPARIGAEVQGDMCFAINSCVDTALAEAELFKTGGPIGDGTPWKIVGTRGLETPQFPDFPSGRPRDPTTGLVDLAHTPEQLYEKLKPYGEDFAPRTPGTYTPEQLDLIWNGRPIPVDGPEAIAGILEREGVGSQGLVIVERRTPLDVPEGQINGHVLNGQNRGTPDFIDRTFTRWDVADIENWFYFPIQ